jgi:ER-bound oxygenase mpaB/B'/Rubber oxygenase, catalytic domain
VTESLPPARLEQLRCEVDEPVDALASRFAAAHPHVAAKDLWSVAFTLLSDDTPDEDPVIAAYLAERPPLPDWADIDRICRAQRWFEANAFAVNVAMIVGSLPMAYCGGDGAEVLLRTGELEHAAQRRVFESALLVLEISRPDGLEPGGPGYRSARRMRFLHAVVRHLLLVEHFDAAHPDQPAGPWDVHRLGAPVNQLDLLATLWAFALTSLDVLDRSGLGPEPDEREAWVHLWGVVGHVLGLAHPDLLQLDEQAARDAFGAVQRRQERPSDAGRRLTGALIALVEELIPFRRADRVAAGSIRYYVGPRRADLLGVPRHGPARFFPRVRGFWLGWRGALPRWVRRRHSSLSWHLLHRLADELVEDSGPRPTLRDVEQREALLAYLRPASSGSG